MGRRGGRFPCRGGMSATDGWLEGRHNRGSSVASFLCLRLEIVFQAYFTLAFAGCRSSGISVGLGCVAALFGVRPAYTFKRERCEGIQSGCLGFYFWRRRRQTCRHKWLWNHSCLVWCLNAGGSLFHILEWRSQRGWRRLSILHAGCAHWFNRGLETWSI